MKKEVFLTSDVSLCKIGQTFTMILLRMKLELEHKHERVGS